MDVRELSQLARSTGRFSEVVSILLKYGLADWLRSVDADWAHKLLANLRMSDLGDLSQNERIRQAITELGTTFIKLGQVLSTRPDLVGMELANELASLRSGTPPDAAEVVLQTIEAELSGPVEQLYREFDTTALASASIGQVHKAVLLDGTPVVVKVQHAGIESRIHNDLDIMVRLAELAEEHSVELRQYQPLATAAEFRRTLLRELDFQSELRNLQRFRRNFAKEPGVFFPEPYPALSSKRVLTMDRLDGVNLSDKEALKAARFDLNALAKRGADLFIKMIFRDAFYHADPHPGNLMVLPSRPGRAASESSGASESSSDDQSVIGVLDCGMVGRLDEPLREDIERALLAINNRDADVLLDVIVRRGATPDDLDRDQLQADIEDFIDEYAHQSLSEFDLGGCLEGVISVIRTHGIVMPAKVGMLLKVMIMLEGTVQQLDPQFNLAEMLQPYGERAIAEKYSPQRIFHRMSARFRDWDRLVDALPRDATEILQRLTKGSFEVHLNHRRLEATVNRLVMGVLTAALFVGSTSMLSSRVPPVFHDVSIVGALGCVFAVGLGFTLVRSIRQSTGNDRR